MKKILLTVFSIAFCFYSINNAHGFVRYEDNNRVYKILLKMTGYVEYAPFGWVEDYKGGRGGFYTVFKPLLDIFEADKEANVEINKEYFVKDTDQIVQKVRSGEIDFFLGAYNETELFKGLQLLYPAVIYNPINVFMLPNRVGEVKSVEDLKKLKGIRNSNEIFSDFVEKKIAEYLLSGGFL